MKKGEFIEVSRVKIRCPHCKGIDEVNIYTITRTCRNCKQKYEVPEMRSLKTIYTNEGVPSWVERKTRINGT